MKLNEALYDEATDGSEGSAAGSGDGGSPASPAAAPAEQTPAPSDQTPSTGADWYSPADEQTQAYIKSKGWADPLSAVKSYQHAERALKVDPEKILIRPRDDDPDGQRDFWQKLGAGKDPSEYTFDVPEGSEPNTEYLDHIAKTCHELGIPVNQAKALAAKNNDFVMQSQEKKAQEYEQQVKIDKETLRNEWRDGFDRKIKAAADAVNKLGFDGEVVDALESHLGYANTVRKFAEIATKLGEPGFVSGQPSGQPGNFTPAEAAAEIQQLNLDPNFVKALTDRSHPGHKGAVERRRQLFQIAYPE